MKSARPTKRSALLHGVGLHELLYSLGLGLFRYSVGDCN